MKLDPIDEIALHTLNCKYGLEGKTWMLPDRTLPAPHPRVPWMEWKSDRGDILYRVFVDCYLGETQGEFSLVGIATVIAPTTFGSSGFDIPPKVAITVSCAYLGLPTPWYLSAEFLAMRSSGSTDRERRIFEQAAKMAMGSC